MSAGDDLFRGLPELPQETFEAAGILERSQRGPFVTLRPHVPPLPKKPSAPAHGPPKTSTTKQRYYTQAIYPRVFCYDPGELIEEMTLGEMASEPIPSGAGPPKDLKAAAPQERFYKLSTLKSGPLRRPLFCSVKAGPWLAEVWQTTSCIQGDSDRWDFAIIEIPEVAMTWWGQWEGMPAFPSLSVIMTDLVPSGPPYPPAVGDSSGAPRRALASPSNYRARMRFTCERQAPAQPVAVEPERAEFHIKPLGAVRRRFARWKGVARALRGRSLGVLALRSSTPSSLLPTYLCDLLNKVVINVRIGDDPATPPIGVAENDLDGLLVVRDLTL